MTSPVSDAMIEAGVKATPMNFQGGWIDEHAYRAIYLAMKAKEEASDKGFEPGFFEQTAGSGLETFAPNKEQASDRSPVDEQIAEALWNHNKLVGCSKGYHEGASDAFADASPEEREEIMGYARAVLSSSDRLREALVEARPYVLRHTRHPDVIPGAVDTLRRINAALKAPTNQAKGGGGVSDAFLIDRARVIASRIAKARCWHQGAASFGSGISTKWFDLNPADVEEAIIRLQEFADEHEALRSRSEQHKDIGE